MLANSTPILSLLESRSLQLANGQRVIGIHIYHCERDLFISVVKSIYNHSSIPPADTITAFQFYPSTLNKLDKLLLRP